MEPVITFQSVVLLLGVVQGVFLALLLANVKGNDSVARCLLALLVLTFAVDLGVDFLHQTRYLAQFPKLIFVELVTSFLYGPLAYLYARALTSRSGFRFARLGWVHFLPFVVSIALLFPFYLLSDEQVVDLIYFDADVVGILGLWVIGGLVVQFLPVPVIGVYLVLAVRRLARHRRAIREEFSSIERISLNWLRNLLIALGALYLIYLFGTLLDLGVDTVLDLLIVAVIYAMGYMGVRQPSIFIRTKHERPLENPEPPGRKYQKSALDAQTSRTLLEELRRHIAAEKPYLDSGLTLSQLAEQLGISANYLSQVINEQTGQNFFEFIGQHRVEAAKQMFADPAQARLSILTIAMDAGFNSKSAFYTAFKQHAGLTPSQFRKSLRQLSGPATDEELQHGSVLPA